MAQTEGQRRASDAVAAWLAHREWNNSQLVAATGVDAGTIGDFLNGQRWPKTGTQGKIEKAIGWEPGTIRSIANGAPVPPLATEEDQAGTVPVGGGVDPDLLADLAKASPEAIDAVRAVLKAARGQ